MPQAGHFQKNEKHCTVTDPKSYTQPQCSIFICKLEGFLCQQTDLNDYVTKSLAKSKTE